MDVADYRDFCLALPGSTEGFPFDSQTLVFKVGGKMYALLDVDSFESVNLKGKPQDNEDRRDAYEGVTPGYHMSKVHWITVRVRSDVPWKLLLDWTKESYDLVKAGLPAKVRADLG